MHGTNESRRSLLVTVLSPLLFHSPDTHLRGLEKIWVDKVITEKPWKTFVETLKNEWIEFILYVCHFLLYCIACVAPFALTPNLVPRRQCC